jgi:hypothetical protein
VLPDSEQIAQRNRDFPGFQESSDRAKFRVHRELSKVKMRPHLYWKWSIVHLFLPSSIPSPIQVNLQSWFHRAMHHWSGRCQWIVRAIIIFLGWEGLFWLHSTWIAHKPPDEYIMPRTKSLVNIGCYSDDADDFVRCQQ